MKEIPLELSVRLISPRIVAVITSMNEAQKVNAAPFSFVFPLSFNPPLLLLGIGKGKLTAKNILKTKEFVVNIVSTEFAQKAVDTERKDCRFWEKIEKAGLHLSESKKVKVPRVKESQAVLECILHEELKVRESDHNFIVGKVVRAECEHLNEKSFPDLDKLGFLMHASKEEFRRVGERINLIRRK